MKKIFKAMAILAATAAVGTGVGLATGCNAGYNGEYEGEYYYTNSYGVKYGMKVKVTVENNIITKVVDSTKGEYVIVSEGWVNYYVTNWKADNKLGDVEPEYDQYGAVTEACAEKIGAVYHKWYKWENSNESNWTDNEAWLLQQYEGKAASDIIAIQVNIKDNGEPYEIKDSNNQAHNSQLNDSGLLISGATQGSGRLMLAVQKALGKKIEIGRIEK